MTRQLPVTLLAIGLAVAVGIGIGSLLGGGAGGMLAASPESARFWKSRRRSWEPAVTAVRAAAGSGDGAELDDATRSTLRDKALA